MGKATLARQRAIGAIGFARVGKLDDAGLVVVDQSDYERLKADLVEARRQVKLLQLNAGEQQIQEIITRFAPGNKQATRSLAEEYGIACRSVYNLLRERRQVKL